MQASNYKLNWITTGGTPREKYFDSLPGLRSYAKFLNKDFGYIPVSSLWENSKWTKFVVIGSAVVTLAMIQTYIKRLM